MQLNYNMQILNQSRNELLKRNEVKGIVSSSGNLGFENAMKIVVDKMKTAEENVVIKNVKSKFGRDTFLIEALVYDSVDDKMKIEPKVKEKKKVVA